MIIPKLLLIMFAFSVIPVAGQTVSEMEQAFGKPTLAYSVSEHIWMTPEFAADGQVCRMRFHPKRVEKGIAYKGGLLKVEELKRVLNRVVPPSLRGAKKGSFGDTTLTGAIAQTQYEYEKVSFSFSVSTNISAEALEKSVLVDLDSPDGFVPPAFVPPPSEADFDQDPSAEIVILLWNDRTCVEDTKGEANQQGLADIERQFGQPKKIYSVRSHTSMTPAFAVDGQICQMWLYPKLVSATGNHLGMTRLTFNEVKSFLNAWVPPEQRGRKLTVNFAATATGGGNAWTTYPYENVFFMFWTAPGPEALRYSEDVLRRGEFTFSITDWVIPAVDDGKPSKDDFSRDDKLDVAIVRWEHRTCVGL